MPQNLQAREFSADIGDLSSSTHAGPDDIEKDFDKLFNALNPNATQEDGSEGGIGPENIREDGLGDNALGDLTPNQNIDTSTFEGVGGITTILSVFAKNTKAITGKDNWYTAPVISIEGIKNSIDSIENDIDTLDSYKASKTYVDSEIAAVVLGQIPDGSLIDSKLSNAAGQIKDRVSANTSHRSSDGTGHSHVELNDEHRGTTSGNPHSVSKSDVGLGAVVNVAQLPISYLDTDGEMNANSDMKVPSQKATKTYVDNAFNNLAGAGRTDETVKGNADAISNLAGGGIEDGSITDAKLSDEAGQIKDRFNTLNELIKANDNSAEMYYDEDLILATLDYGIDVTGKITLSESIYLLDSKKAIFGTNFDMEMYHDDVDGILVNTKGSFKIFANATELGMAIVPNAGVESYYNGNKKAETISDGFGILGKLDITKSIYIKDNQAVYFGDDCKMLIFYDGSNGYFNSNLGMIRISNTNFTKIMAQFIIDGACELFHNNVKKAETISGGWNVIGDVYRNGTALSDDIDNIEADFTKAVTRAFVMM